MKNKPLQFEPVKLQWDLQQLENLQTALDATCEQMMLSTAGTVEVKEMDGRATIYITEPQRESFLFTFGMKFKEEYLKNKSV